MSLDDLFKRIADHPDSSPELEASCAEEDSRDYSRPDYSRVDRAVVASDGDGLGCLLHHTTGGGLEGEIDQIGRDLENLGLGNAPTGISIWEGKYKWLPGSWEYPNDGETEPVGSFRALTDAEWADLRRGEDPLAAGDIGKHIVTLGPDDILDVSQLDVARLDRLAELVSIRRSAISADARTRIETEARVSDMRDETAGPCQVCYELQINRMGVHPCSVCDAPDPHESSDARTRIETEVRDTFGEDVSFAVSTTGEAMVKVGMTLEEHREHRLRTSVNLARLLQDVREGAPIECSLDFLCDACVEARDAGLGFPCCNPVEFVGETEDPRKTALKFGLSQVRAFELRALIEWLEEGRPVLLDRDEEGRANYSPTTDGGCYCPLAIACDYPFLFEHYGENKPTDELVTRQLERRGLKIYNTRGVAGEFYTTERRRDLLTAAREVLAEKGRDK